jgi:RHS repeat-associated protein
MVTTNSYDTAVNGANLLSTTVDSAGLGLTTWFDYDIYGNISKVTDARGDGSQTTFTTTIAYDPLRRPILTTDALGNITEAFYSPSGLATRVERRNGIGTILSVGESEFTATNKLFRQYNQQCFDAAGVRNTGLAGCGISAVYYDGNDREEVIVDPLKRKTRNVYNGVGAVLYEVRAFQWTEGTALPAFSCTSGVSLRNCYASYAYTPSGQQTSVKDANGNLTSYNYDDFNRLEQTTFPSPTTAGVSNSADYEALTYDANGNVLSKRTRAGAVLSSTYDALGRVITKTPGIEVATAYEYDPVGRPTKTRFTNGTYDITYGYDSAGRLTTVNDIRGASNRQLTYVYDAASNRTRLTYPDGFYVTYDYDALNRMTNIWENGLSTIASYSYNALSQRTGLTYGNGRSVAYAFEADGALDLLDHRDSLNASTVSYSFDYNLANQVTSKAISNASFAFTPPANDNETYVSNGLNQYSSVTKNSVPFTLAYDGNGSLTSDGGAWTYGYNAENQLVSAVGSSVSALFEYDPNGRRSRKSGTGVTDTSFLTDGNEMLAEYNSAGTMLRRYVYGVNIDERLLMYTGSGTANKSYVHANYQSSTIATSDSFGTVVDMFAYDSYGKTNDGSGIPFKYTGRYYDAETGLYYYRSRYYSDALGRFLQTDFIGYRDGLNWYAYVGNDPINNTDPSGLCKISDGELTDCEVNRNENEEQAEGVDAFIETIVTIGEAIYVSGDQELIDAFESIDVLNFSDEEVGSSGESAKFSRGSSSSFTENEVIPDVLTFYSRGFSSNGNARTALVGHEIEHFTVRNRAAQRRNIDFENAADRNSIGFLQSTGLLPTPYTSYSIYNNGIIYRGNSYPYGK